MGGRHTGGIAKHVEDLSTCLVERGIQPLIWDFTLGASFDKDGILVRSNNILEKFLSLLYAAFGLNIFLSDRYSMLSFREKIIVGIQALQLKQCIDNNRISIIHVHSLNRAITGYLRHTFPKKYLVVTDHGFWQNKQLQNSSDNRAWKKLQYNLDCSDEAIIISDYARKMHEQYNFQCKKYTLIPNPIRLQNLPLLNLKRKKQVLFNGYNKSVSVKNFNLVVEAMNSDAFFEEFKLVAIADVEAHEYMKGKKTRFDHVILGPQPWETLIELYNTSRLLVVPSKSESFGLVYLEAMATQTPVIGFHRMIDEFKSRVGHTVGEGFDSERESHVDLANKMKNLLQHGIPHEGIRDAVKEHYEWDNKIFDFLNIYQINHE